MPLFKLQYRWFLAAHYIPTPMLGSGATMTKSIPHIGGAYKLTEDADISQHIESHLLMVVSSQDPKKETMDSSILDVGWGWGGQLILQTSLKGQVG